MSTALRNRNTGVRSRTRAARPQTRAAAHAQSADRGKKEGFNWRKWFSSGKKVNRRDLIAFSRELSTLLDAGIGISPALELLAEERKNTALEPIIRQLKEDLSTGSTIGAAMARHPDVFPKIFVRTVSTADRGAPLSATLMRSAAFLDSAASAITQAKRAMIYPALVMLVGIGIVFMLLTVSLPQMIGLFNNLGAELPLPTKVLIAVSNFIRADGKYLLPVFLIGVLVFWRFIKTAAGRMWLHGVTLKLPVVSGVVLSSDLARASAAMASLSEAGLPLPEALEVAKDTVSNDVVRSSLADAQKGLMAGEGLARPLARSGVFPPTFVQTLRVAEDTGTLDANLRRMADLYSKEASDKVKAMASLVEPFATISVALAVGFIALAVIMPMYTVLGSIEK